MRDIAASPDGILVGPAFEPVTGRIDDSNGSRFTQINPDGTANATTFNSNIQTIEIVQTAATTFTSRQVRQGQPMSGSA